MAQTKTGPGTETLDAVLARIDTVQRRTEAKRLAEIVADVTGFAPVI